MAPLIDVSYQNPLGPGEPRDEFQAALAELTVNTAFEHEKLADREMAKCCLSGLWLHHDFLDRSHDYSQEISSNSGSYWHGIMHRREQDYGNAKYWFRQVGDHPAFDRLTARIAQTEWESPEFADQLGLNLDAWDPYAFVDACEQSVRNDDATKSYCQTIACFEWQELFRFCYDQAIA